MMIPQITIHKLKKRASVDRGKTFINAPIDGAIAVGDI